jgi:hypothetical protein
MPIMASGAPPQLWGGLGPEKRLCFQQLRSERTCRSISSRTRQLYIEGLLKPKNGVQGDAQRDSGRIVGYSYRAWMPLLWKHGLSSHGRA